MLKKELRCFIVGETSLCVQCAQELLAQNYKILGIISRDSFVRSWADNHSILCIPSLEDFESLDLYGKFDYLFSIANYFILSGKILSFPSRCSINYHDGPLPKYAGVHAPSWALLNREAYYGVSWHEIELGLDKGRLLKQVTFPVDNVETSFTLNLKCYEKAIESFKELIIDLQEDKISFIEQDLTQRTYFHRHQKPYNLGVALWNQSSADISLLHRALDFGDYDNTFCSFKLLLNGYVYYPTKHFAIYLKSKKDCGVIEKITETAIYISTSTKTIAFEKFKDEHGYDCSIEQVIRSSQIKEGDILKQLTKKKLMVASKVMDDVSKNEAFWLQKLLELAPSPQVPLTGGKHTFIYEGNFLYDSQKAIENSFSSFTDLISSAFLIYLNRCGNSPKFTVGLISSFTETISKEGCFLFSKVVPFTCNISSFASLSHIFSYVKENLNNLMENKTYLSDVFVRYSSLREKSHDFFSVIIRIGTTRFDPASWQENSKSRPLVILDIHEKQRTYTLYLKNVNETSSYIGDGLSMNLRKLVEQILCSPQLPLGKVRLEPFQDKTA